MQHFHLTSDHLRTLSRSHIGFVRDEVGPYLNIELDNTVEQTDENYQKLRNALEIVLLQAGCATEPGLYQLEKDYDHHSWKMVPDTEE